MQCLFQQKQLPSNIISNNYGNSIDLLNLIHIHKQNIKNCNKNLKINKNDNNIKDNINNSNNNSIKDVNNNNNNNTQNDILYIRH